MNEFKPYGPRDEASYPDGDDSFVGVDERLGPSQLPAAYAASATNMRFRFGKPETRPGAPLCPWMKGDGKTPWDEVYGGAVFSDPNQTDEWILVAADGGVWRTRPGMVAKAVSLPAGVILTAATFSQFVQCFNVIILLRGADQAPLVCTNLDEGFKPVPTPILGSGLSVIPNSAFGLSYLNRLLLIDGKDTVAVSDIQDYTSYLALANAFRINEGNTDRLVAMAAFGKGTLIMLKSGTVLQVTGATGDLTGATLDDVTDKYGCGAARSVVKSGTNLYWVTEDAQVASLQLSLNNETQDTQTYLSDPLQKSFARVNGRYIGGIASAVWRGRLYVALPLDEAKSERLVAPPAIVYEVNNGGPVVYTSLTVGRTYHWIPGINEVRLTCGGTVMLAEGTFMATSATATATGPGIHHQVTDYTGTLNLVIVGTNTGVAVYDFLNQAWCGTDESPGIFSVKQFLKPKINGKQRLVMLNADGTLRLYEEGFEDDARVPVNPPYTDVLVNTKPAVGDTITVNATLAATAANQAGNAPDVWGCNTLGNAQTNLFIGFNAGSFTYDQSLTKLSVMDWGMRFIGLAGDAPAITNTGTWAFIMAHTGMEIQPVQIVSTLVTRGYRSAARVMNFADTDRKRFLALVLQLETWNPQYTITTLVQGFNADADYVVDETRSNVTYDLQNRADWDPTNANDDHGTPKRQDYSVSLPDAGFNFGSGVNLDAHQASTVRVPVSEHGHYMQLQIVNRQGRMALVSAMMEAQADERLSGAIA